MTMLRNRLWERTVVMALVMLVMVAGLTSVDGTRSWSKSHDALMAAGNDGGVKSAVAGSLAVPGMLSFVDPCYDEHDRARRCVPDFVNAAFGQAVEATSTCGDPPSTLPPSLSTCLPRPPSRSSAVSVTHSVIGLLRRK